MFPLEYIILAASLLIFDDNYCADWSEANSIPRGVGPLSSGNLFNCSGNDLLNLIDSPNCSPRKTAVCAPVVLSIVGLLRRRPPRHGSPIHYNFARNKHNSINFIQLDSLLQLPTKAKSASTNTMVKNFMVPLPKYHSILNRSGIISTQFIATLWNYEQYKPINRHI